MSIVKCNFRILKLSIPPAYTTESPGSIPRFRRCHSANSTQPHDLIPAANGGRHTVPPTLSPNAATRGRGGRHGVEHRARESAPARYRPRRSSRSVLYRCVQEHLETWLAQCREGHDDDGPVPEPGDDARAMGQWAHGGGF